MKRQVNRVTDRVKSLNNASDDELEWGRGVGHLAASWARYVAYAKDGEGGMIRGVELGKISKAAPGTRQDYIMKWAQRTALK